MKPILRTTRGSLLLPAIPLLLAALSVTFSSCGNSKSEQNSGTGDSTVEMIARIRVEEVNPQTFSETLHLTGFVKSVEDVVVSTEEGGVLMEWLVPKGGYVQEKGVIARMNDDVLLPQYEAAKAQYEIAELTYQKQFRVFQEQGISEVQVKSAQYARDAAKAQMELARNRFERTRIKSPISGILDDRLVDAGELAAPGVPVARIVNLDRMKVQVNVPEVQAGAVARGSDATISVSAFPGESFAGKTTFVGSSVVADNRTIPVEIVLRNPGRRLKPDMIARVTVKGTSRRTALLVEEQVVQQIDQRTTVVYVEHEGRAERRAVVLGGRNNGKVEVLTGLSQGDRVIVSGYQDVYDGQQVEVVPEETSPEVNNEAD
jgi:membrane fusion protein (multidrug efflux system)